MFLSFACIPWSHHKGATLTNTHKHTHTQGDWGPDADDAQKISRPVSLLVCGTWCSKSHVDFFSTGSWEVLQTLHSDHSSRCRGPQASLSLHGDQDEERAGFHHDGGAQKPTTRAEIHRGAHEEPAQVGMKQWRCLDREMEGQVRRRWCLER